MAVCSEPLLYIFHDTAHDAEWNMHADEALFCHVIDQAPKDILLRFYRFNAPSYTVGYGIWKRASGMLQGGIPAVRRPTGGGIVCHGRDLTYSLVLPVSLHQSLNRARTSYAFIHEVLLKTLRSFGFQAELQKEKSGNGNFCFDSPVEYDVMIGARKTAGGAQKRSSGFILHQGSIDWDFLIRLKPELKENEWTARMAEFFSETFGCAIKKMPFHVETMMKDYGYSPHQTARTR